MRFLSVVLLAACAAAKPQFPVLEDITKSLEDITKGLEKAVAEIANAGAQIGEGFEEAGVDLGKTLDEVNADVVESIEKALNDPNNPLKNLPQNLPNFPDGFKFPGGLPQGLGFPSGLGGPPGGPPAGLVPPPGGLPIDPAEIVMHLEKLNSICNGTAPEKCNCFYGDGGKENLEPPFENPIEIMDCVPDVCTCEDGSTVKADRPAPIFTKPLFQLYKIKIKTRCLGEIESCPCQYGDKTEITVPWTDEDELLNCNPKECKCADGTTEAIDEPTPPEFVQDMFAERQEELTKLCEGEVPTQCTCSNPKAQGTFDPSAEGNGLRHMYCRPALCTCASGTDVKYPRPARPNFPERIRAEIESIMCGGNADMEPISCRCDENKNIVPPFNLKKVMQCQPTECTCMPREDEDGEPITFDLVESVTSTKSPIGRLNKICDGEAPTECTCIRQDKSIKGPFTASKLFNIVLGCGPNKCTCADGSIRKTQIPIRPLLDMKELCDGLLPKSCTCHDGETRLEKIHAGSILDIMKECRPRSCLCNEGEDEKPVQMFGCKAGGTPNCLNEAGEKGKLICDGKVLTVRKLAEARLEGKCVCEDGDKPVCSNTGKTPKCFDGADPNPDLAGAPQAHLRECTGPAEE